MGRKFSFLFFNFGFSFFFMDLEVACLVSAHVNIDWIIFFFYILLMSCVNSGVRVPFCFHGAFSEHGGLKVSI